MPQTIDLINFPCGPDIADWPKLSCVQPRQLALDDADLRLEANQEILFQDNGQIRSLDDNHRLVFNRTGGLMELHEAGDILFLTGGPTPTERMRILASGAVGIGTTTPTAQLHVSGDLRVTGNSDLNGNLTVTGNIGIGMAPTQGLHISAARSARFELGAGQRLSLGSSGTFEIDALGTAGGRLMVTDGGHVGIGTATPGAPLHVADYMAVGPFAATTGQGGIDVTGPTAEFSFVRRSLSAWPGTPQAGDRFVWYNPDGTARLWTEQNGDLLTVNNTGNVGIGTTSPLTKLHVEGDLRVNGTVQVPKTGTGFALLTNRTFDNEASFQSGNVKLQMGSIGPFFFPTPLSYEFAIGHTHTFLSGGAGGLISLKTNFVKLLSINQDGDLFIAGSKGGYIVEHFYNQSGETVEEGDVVVLGAQGASHYLGSGSRIPLPEVDLTDRAYDTRVCGIVAKAVPENDLPPVEIEQTELPQELQTQAAEIQAQMAETGQAMEAIDAEPYEHPLQQFAAPSADDADRGQILNQKLGKMVTLGAFAHCKVDADIAPIAPGDLLTTSPTKGHAQKVLQPEKAIGAIVGKALGSLEAGKDKIPILVLLQ